MNSLDWILVVLVCAYALSGYWQGFITGAFATAGLLLGGLFGVWIAPTVLGSANPSVWVSLGALFLVILSASLGQAVLQYAGAQVRGRITWRPVRALDALGGAMLSACAVLVVAWALAVAVSGSNLHVVTKEVRGSVVLRKVDRVMPQSADEALGAFNNVVGTSFFPRYLEPFEPEHIVKVGPGPRSMLSTAAVRQAETRVFKVHGASSCGRGVEGSGFEVAHDYVMTNAHVVAGVGSPSVVIGGNDVPATPVYYDPQFDVALLHVDTGDLGPLSFADAKQDDPVVVLGYPQDGPFDAEPGRIRSEDNLRSPDIYGDGAVIRDVYALRGLIRPGNSGGPAVDSDGKVVGVVFAASVTDTDTGYALTAKQVHGAMQAVGRTAGVSTEGCAD
jgi:S1-C subfamily serine protease